MADLHSYQPNRFISEEKNQLDLRGQHFHLLPFGSGRRGCPGTSPALQVVQTTLATLIQCFKWKANGEERTVDMEEGPRLTLPRAHPLISVPVTRLSTRLDSTEFDVYILHLRFQTLFFFSYALTVISHEFIVQKTKNTVHVMFTGPTILFTQLKIILLQCF